MKNKYAAYFSIEKQLKQQGFYPERAELIAEFTNGEKSSLRDLSHIEYVNFLSWLQTSLQSNSTNTNWQQSPENKMRQKLWCIFVKEMNYSQQEYEKWVIKYGKFNRPIKHHTKEQLQVLLTQAEKVLNSYTKSLNQ